MVKGIRWLVGLSMIFFICLPFVGIANDLTVTWGEDQTNLATLDPRITQSRHELQVIRQIFDSLITFDKAGNPVPWLATSWEVSPDSKEVTFHLRENVIFHDGTPCNAEAFRFTYESIASPELGSQGAIDYLGPYKDTEVVDEYTFKVKFATPYAGMMSAFALSYLAPVSPTAVKKLGDGDFAANPVGTGPFRFVEWVRRSHVTLAKNEDYNWAPPVFKHQGPAYIDTLVFQLIQENSTRVGALRTGEIDAGDMIPPLDARDLEENPDFRSIMGRVGGIPVGMYLNTSKAPTDDINVRRAVFYALDMATIVDRVFFGYMRAAFGPIAPNTPCYWSGVEAFYPYDPDKARELLEDAGWVDKDNDGIREKDGKDLNIYCPIIFKPNLMTAVQAELKKVGINLQVDNVVKEHQDELIMNNQYGAGLIRWVATDPSVLKVILDSENIPAPGYFKFNWQRYASNELDQLLIDAEAARSTTERCSIYQQIQEIVLDKALIVPLQETTQTVVYDARLVDLVWEIGNYQVIFYDVRRVE